MNLYTCSYNEYKPEMGLAVRISAGVPNYNLPGFNPFRAVMKASPDWSYMSGDGENYNTHFYAQIKDYGITRFKAEFEKLRKKEGVKKDHPLVFLCFEKLGKRECDEPEHQIQTEMNTCHRRKFAEWWEEQTGEHMGELGTRVQLKKQFELF